MTIQEFISDAQQHDINIKRLHYQKVLDEQPTICITTNYECVLDRYMSELDKIKVPLEMTDEELTKYMYNPKRLSYELYGVTDFWFMILAANQMYSAVDFNKRNIFVYSKSAIRKVISYILQADRKIYNLNAEETKQAQRAAKSVITSYTKI